MKKVWRKIQGLSLALCLMSFGGIGYSEGELVSTDTEANEVDDLGGEVEVNEQASESSFFISDGTRIEAEGKGFTLIPPAGWEVHKNYPGTSLFLQTPYREGMDYQQSIQVMRRSGSQFIDETTAKEFEEIISKKFPLTMKSVSDYHIRDYTKTKLTDGSHAYLFYAAFNIGDIPLMQAHLLASSETHHFLLTFTDLAENFETEGKAGENLSTAWATLTSLELDSRAPARYEVTVAVAFVSGLLLFGLFLVLAIRRYRASYQFADEESWEEDENKQAKPKNRRRSRRVAEDDHLEAELTEVGGEDASNPDAWNVGNPVDDFDDDETDLAG